MDDKNIKLNNSTAGNSTKDKEPPIASSGVIKSSTLTQDEVIRRRLVIDGDGGGDDRRIQTLLKSFLTMCSSEDLDKNEDEGTFRRLIQQIQQLEYSAKRTHAAIAMNEATKSVYAALDSSIEEETKKTRKTIQEAKQTIEEETKHRKHSMEYEALSKLIESKPDRKATDARRKQLEETVQNFTELRKDLVDAVANRDRQVKSLAFAVESLKNDIEAEDFKVWGTSSPGTLKVDTPDPFPLEKEVFPELNSDSQPSRSRRNREGGTQNSTDTVGTSNAAKAKYEELSEESPEEGESED